METTHQPDPDPGPLGAPWTPDPESPPPDPQSLWNAFCNELWADQAWDSEFTASPHNPSGPLRELVDQAGVKAVPFLVEALTAKDSSLVYWACVGLRWLGPLAGEEAADALVAYIAVRGQADGTAAVALEAIDPVRARAVGVQRHRGVMQYLMRFHLEQGIDAAYDFIEWILDHEDAPVIGEMLRSTPLRDAVIEQCPPRLSRRLKQLAQTYPSESVRQEAGRLLGLAPTSDSAVEMIATLVQTEGISLIALEHLASHRDSTLLMKQLVDRENTNYLANLLRRRRCAGWQTDPTPVRLLLREKLERPNRQWRYEEHDVHYAALCVAELGDVELIDSLIAAVVPENCGFAWDPLVRAFWSLGTPAREALQNTLIACPPGERKKRLEWMRDAIERRKVGMQEALDAADSIFLRGRIEPSVYGAFRAYGDVLLIGPSAHAAFQLAWIDRAFGSEILPERIQWIQNLGFHDDTLLTELATPLPNPLYGMRFLWDGGETANDARRVTPALEAGLPSLAAHWSRGTEKYQRVAEECLERVRQATRYITRIRE